MRRPVIALDIDDVLAASAEGFANYSNRQWGTSLTADDYQEDWAAVWGISTEEAVARAAGYHKDGVMRTYRPLYGAHKVLSNLSKRYSIILVTSRRRVVDLDTRAWLNQHFPDVFSGLEYAGIWDDDTHTVERSLSRTKRDICHRIGASYLIDDQPKHCIDAHSGGVAALLFGEYSWNQEDCSLPEEVVRVANWIEVGRYFDDQG